MEVTILEDVGMPEELLMFVFISFLTLSYISFMISSSFLACKRSAF